MPERPELEYVVSVLSRALPGCRVDRVDVLDPVVLRVAVPGDPRELLTGRHVTAVNRRAHFVILSFDGGPSLDLAIHPMLAGRFTLCAPETRRTKDIALVLSLRPPDGEPRELRYRDERQMGKVWLLRPDQRAQAPGLADVGIDVLGPEFTRERFRALCKKRTDQAKNFLLDKGALDAMGNAYADEVLWAARIHPKARVAWLDAAAVDRLHAAIREVLTEARDEVARRAPALDEKVRDFNRVRNRKGEPCPRCAAPIRVAGVNGHDAFFCATCQPDEQGRGFVGWRTTGGA